MIKLKYVLFVLYIDIIIYEYYVFYIENMCLCLLCIIIDIMKLFILCELLKGIGGFCLNGEFCDDIYGIVKCVYV